MAAPRGLGAVSAAGGWGEPRRAAAWSSAGALAALAVVALAAAAAAAAGAGGGQGEGAGAGGPGGGEAPAGGLLEGARGPEPGGGAGPAPRDPDVVMPSKSSRPGCEEDDACYIPSATEVAAGGSVTWRNDDVAFHTVTSGEYGSPDGAFDSGHMDPGEEFTVAFGEAGEVVYHCTLHPWMRGTVAVSPPAAERTAEAPRE